MTTTTKVFVILVCLFSFIFTPMAIQFAARTENWRKAAEDWREYAETAYASERSALAMLASDRERCRDMLDQENERLLTSQQSVAELQRDLEELAQERDQLARSRDNWETSARLLTAEMKVKSTHNAELADMKEKALASERDLRAKYNEQNDRIKELSARVVILSQQLKQKLQEIASFRDENEQLRQRLNLGKAGEIATASPTPSARAEAPAAIAPIRGEVTVVSGSRATISVGAASGLEKGMIMVVLRDGNYICDLEISSEITTNEAVGLIKFEQDKRIQLNDEVVDAGTFEKRQ